MTLDLYLAYLATALVFFATPPGPSQVLFMSGAMRFGTRRALPIMAGDLTANAAQILAAGFGLAALIATSATAFAVIKWVGIAYLAFIGVRMLLSRQTGGQADPPPPGRLFRQGFLTSAANPYAVIFFAALFPQFIVPTAPILPQILLLGGTYLVLDAMILLAMGGAAHSLTRALGARVGRWLPIVSGGAMIAAAATLALREPPVLDRPR